MDKEGGGKKKETGGMGVNAMGIEGPVDNNPSVWDPLLSCKSDSCP